MRGLELALALAAVGSTCLAVGVVIGSWSREAFTQRDQARADLARAQEQVRLVTELHWVTAQELHDRDERDRYGPAYLEECDCSSCADPFCPCQCHR